MAYSAFSWEKLAEIVVFTLLVVRAGVAADPSRLMLLDFISFLLVLFCSDTQSSRPMPTKLYIGNIPASVDSTELKELFEKYGKVLECDIVKDYAFVVSADSTDRT